MNPGLWCRPILPHEAAFLREAAAINNMVWGDHLAHTAEDFTSRAAHGFLVGAFSSAGLQGTISGVELPAEELADAGCCQGRLATWNGASGEGTFRTATPGADCLCCMAVTAASASPPPRPGPKPAPDNAAGRLAHRLESIATGADLTEDLLALAEAHIKPYLDANIDPVMRFHMKDKGPLPGASIWVPVPRGRIDDIEALGFNVLLRYPELTEPVRDILLTPSDYAPGSVGEALVLAAARTAATLPNLKYVVPYSRPLGFRRTLARALRRLAGEDIPFKKENEKTFQEAITLP